MEEEVVVIGEEEEEEEEEVVVIIGEEVVVVEEIGTTVDMEGREGDTSTKCIIFLQFCQCV